MSIVFRFKVPNSGQHLHKYPKSMHVQKLNQSKWKEFNLRQFIFIFYICLFKPFSVLLHNSSLGWTPLETGNPKNIS